MKFSHALAGIRQLCCSGLSEELVVTELLIAVQGLIHSNSNTFSACGDDLRPRYHLCATPLGSLTEVIPGVISDYITPGRMNRAAAWLARHPVIDDPLVVDPDFYDSTMYRDIYRPLDMHHLMWAATSLNGRPNGMLGLYRPASQRPFSERDRRVFAQLIPYVSHALGVGSEQRVEFASEGHTGLLIANRSGEVLYESPEARALLAKACHPRVTSDGTDRSAVLEIIPSLCRDLDTIFRGGPAAPPNRRHIGPMGQFDFRAYWLSQSGTDSRDLIGIALEHREPVLIKLLRSVRSLPLSPTQKEVAILLAQGAPYESIGRSLGIKTTTVKDHVSKIYDKMDVRQREDLLPCLLNTPAGAGAYTWH